MESETRIRTCVGWGSGVGGLYKFPQWSSGTTSVTVHCSQMVLVLSPRRHWLFLETLSGGIPGALLAFVGRGRDAAKHLPIYRIDPLHGE